MQAARQPTTEMPVRRDFHRIAVDVLGRFMLEDRTEYPCRVTEMSPGEVDLITIADARIGGRVVIYLDQIGRLEGTVDAHFAGGFSVDLAMSDRKREKLAAQLTWLANRRELNLPEDRRHERIQPRNPFVEIAFEDGQTQKARIIDLSLSGAALHTAIRPALGTRLIVGVFAASVVRHLEEGFAVEFAVAQTVETIAVL